MRPVACLIWTSVTVSLLMQLALVLLLRYEIISVFGPSKGQKGPHLVMVRWPWKTNSP